MAPCPDPPLISVGAARAKATRRARHHRREPPRSHRETRRLSGNPRSGKNTLAAADERGFCDPSRNGGDIFPNGTTRPGPPLRSQSAAESRRVGRPRRDRRPTIPVWWAKRPRDQRAVSRREQIFVAATRGGGERRETALRINARQAGRRDQRARSRRNTRLRRPGAESARGGAQQRRDDHRAFLDERGRPAARSCMRPVGAASIALGVWRTVAARMHRASVSSARRRQRRSGKKRSCSRSVRNTRFPWRKCSDYCPGDCPELPGASCCPRPCCRHAGAGT